MFLLNSRRFGKLLEDWKERIEDIISWIGTVPPPPITFPQVEMESSESTQLTITEGGEEEEEEEEEKKGEKREEGEEKGEARKKKREGKERAEKRKKVGEAAVESVVDVTEMSVEDLCGEVERWSSGLSYAIDTQDNRRSLQVS